MFKTVSKASGLKLKNKSNSTLYGYNTVKNDAKTDKTTKVKNKFNSLPSIFRMKVR